MSTSLPTSDPRSTSLLLSHRVALMIVFLRWSALAMSMLTLLPNIANYGSASIIAATLILSLNAALRTFYAVPLRGKIYERTVNIIIDCGALIVALGLTHMWSSPFLLATIPVLLVIGLSSGFIAPVVATAYMVAAVTGIDNVVNENHASTQSIIQNSLYLLGSGAVGAVMRLFANEAEARSQSVVDEMRQMGHANSLLLALHDVAQTLPASLDLGEVIASTRNRFHDLYDVQYLAIVVADSTHNTYRVELAEGLRMGTPLSVHELPAPLAQTLGTNSTVVHAFPDDGFVGCTSHARSGMYVALRARGNVVGIVALEHADENKYTKRDAALLQELSEPLALAIDNALWFQRLRNMGAEEERSRIARDLHDRLAQSLAYVAFELERLIEQKDSDPELSELRDIVREVVGELRETLYELRATVDTDRPFHALAQEYLPRFGDRTGLDVQFETNISERILPVQIEREMWRIMQEGLNNVYKHAEASHAWVSWLLESNEVHLTIRDDGKGFSQDNAKKERFGLIGMRERADTIHAQLNVTSHPGEGTLIEAEVEVPS
ncbi:MAG TPA: histidine kinase [Acidimicrobiia bacterium]|nr:histidine kinase [Acidimicrobiia bacterium]